MIPSDNAYKTIKKFEGLRLNAYLDQVSVPTIGYGNTFYKDGSKVKMGDKITIEQAGKMLKDTVDSFASKIDALITASLNQNQFDSLISLSYNIGIGAFKKSTLLKKVNADPNNPLIRKEFEKWCKGKGVVLPGLLARRKKEADLYFSNA